MSVDTRQIEREAATWLARRDAGRWTQQEQAQFDAWLDSTCLHRVTFLRLEAVWKETGRLKVLNAGQAHGEVPIRGAWATSPFFASEPGVSQTDVVLSRGAMAEKCGAKRSRGWRWRIGVGLAAMLIIAVIIVAGFAWHAHEQVERMAWHTVLGARQTVHLNDGSAATLSSDTSLHATFSAHWRNLYLTHGEAFFDVAHDRSRPFVVHVNGYRVIAVGTRFDTRREGDQLRVVVTRGLVRLEAAHERHQAPVRLPAGSVALAGGGAIKVWHAPLERVRDLLSWRDGYAVFHDTPLADAVAEFNAYNRHKIIIVDSSLKSLRVGGHFRLDNSAAFVRLMQQVFPVRVHKRGDKTLLYRRGARDGK